MDAIEIIGFCQKQIDLYEVAVASKENELATLQSQIQSLKGAAGSLKLVVAQYNKMMNEVPKLPEMKPPDDGEIL